MSFDRPRDLLYIGRPVPEKGLSDLLAALQAINDLPWGLSVAGELPEPSQSTGDPRISCLGRVPHHEVAALMQHHDVLVVPSRYETFGNIALEGLAVSMVVVAARTGGLKSLITSGWNGFLFNPGDVADLARTLRFVLTHFARLDFAQHNARRTALLYSWEGVAAATARLLRTLIR